MDALSEFLSVVRVEGSLFSRAELAAPWGVTTHGAPDGIFHAVVRGSGQVEVEGEPTRAYRAGDIVVMPHGSAHTMRDRDGSVARHIAELPAELGRDGLPCLRPEGDGPRTSLLCGTFRFDDTGRETLLPALPPVIHVQGGGTAGFLDVAVQHLVQELDAGRPGGSVLVLRLADLLFVGVLRAWLEQSSPSSGWLAALSDPQLARALSAVHGEPARPWTAELLARQAGMSRSAFFARFTERVGEPPAAYVTRWRMTVARSKLRAGGNSMATIADAVGYSSEAAFSKAFKRAIGVPPSVWRRQLSEVA